MPGQLDSRPSDPVPACRQSGAYPLEGSPNPPESELPHCTARFRREVRMNPVQKSSPRTDSNPVFIHSQLDDLGLSSSQFRVYCHLARRSNAGSVDAGVAWASVSEMSRVCRLHPGTVRAALGFLLRGGLICSQPRPGRTTLYRLNRPSAWNLESNLHGAPESKPEQSPDNRREGYPLQSNGDEGSPSSSTLLEMFSTC